MRRNYSASLLACALAITHSASASNVAQQAELDVRAQEAAQVKAVLAGDVGALDALWGAELHVNAPDNAIHDKQSLFSVMKAGVLKYSSYEQVIEYVGLQGDVVVVMGQERVTPAEGKRAGTMLRRRFTDIWMKHDAQWVQIARQDTVVPNGCLQ